MERAEVEKGKVGRKGRVGVGERKGERVRRVAGEGAVGGRLERKRASQKLYK